MVISVGSQHPEYQAFANLTSAADQSRLFGSDRSASGLVQNNIPDDILNLSDDVFETLSSGVRGLRQADANLARQRLQAAEELVSFTRNLLGAASGDQKDAILGNVRQLGETIEGLASQLGQLFAGSGDDEGANATYTETLSAEFSFTSISVREETLEISQLDDGLEVKHTVEQAQLVIAELEVERTQTLSVRSNGDLPSLLASGLQVENIIDDFRSIVQSFQSLVRDLLENFSKDEILPELPADLLQSFLDQVLEVPREGA